MLTIPKEIYSFKVVGDDLLRIVFKHELIKHPVVIKGKVTQEILNEAFSRSVPNEEIYLDYNQKRLF